MQIENRKSEIKNCLIVSATEAECEPTLKKMCGLTAISPHLFSGTLQGQYVEVLISGIGSVSTTFRLTQTLLQRPCDYAISIGIAGSYAEDVDIGETVQITRDCFADLGIDDNGVFRNLRDEGLVCDDFDCGIIINPSPVASAHRHVCGVTVQTTSGSRQRIDELVERYQPQVETMENAAFFYVCRKMQVPFVSFRAISNRVEPRNKKNWQTATAIQSVNNQILTNMRKFM